MSLASCCNVLNFKGAEKRKKSLPVKIAPKTKNAIEAEAIPNQPDRPRMQSVPELRGLQRRPSVCYYRVVLPPIAMPINQRELTNDVNQVRVCIPPASYYCRLQPVYVRRPPPYYYVQRYYPQRQHYPYPPFPQR
ncbi:hypothetical protein MFLAVUS_003866 [Mucor flavus]|uniref:Uncharacterized protein n=1 Tax=Mucor flavus TaxID=439312 RepID=A0ABP9YUB7_9FUNG